MFFALASSTVPYERSDEGNEVPTMIDEFESRSVPLKEVVASVFENYLCGGPVNDGIEKLVGAIDSTQTHRAHS